MTRDTLTMLWCYWVKQGHWYRLCDDFGLKQCAGCGHLAESYGHTDNYLN